MTSDGRSREKRRRTNRALATERETGDQESKGELVAQYQEASFSGPLPPPALLRQYEEILPGTAERIVSMAEKEQGHRHLQDSQALKAATSSDSQVNWLSFAIAIAYLAAAVFVALNASSTVAGILGGTGLVAGLANLLRLIRRGGGATGS